MKQKLISVGVIGLKLERDTENPTTIISTLMAGNKNMDDVKNAFKMLGQPAEKKQRTLNFQPRTPAQQAAHDQKLENDRQTALQNKNKEKKEK